MFSVSVSHKISAIISMIISILSFSIPVDLPYLRLSENMCQIHLLHNHHIRFYIVSHCLHIYIYKGLKCRKLKTINSNQHI